MIDKNQTTSPIFADNNAVAMVKELIDYCDDGIEFSDFLSKYGYDQNELSDNCIMERYAAIIACIRTTEYRPKPSEPELVNGWQRGIIDLGPLRGGGNYVRIVDGIEQMLCDGIGEAWFHRNVKTALMDDQAWIDAHKPDGVFRPLKCPECGGGGYDHPESYASRNSDYPIDCPVCHGIGRVATHKTPTAPDSAASVAPVSDKPLCKYCDRPYSEHPGFWQSCPVGLGRFQTKISEPAAQPALGGGENADSKMHDEKCDARAADSPICRICGKPASCYGTYEGSAGYACDECCGHGNEDGECEPIATPQSVADEAVKPALRLPKRDCDLGRFAGYTYRWNAGQIEYEFSGKWHTSAHQPKNIASELGVDNWFFDSLAEQADAQDAEGTAKVVDAAFAKAADIESKTPITVGATTQPNPFIPGSAAYDSLESRKPKHPWNAQEAEDAAKQSLANEIQTVPSRENEAVHDATTDSCGDTESRLANPAASVSQSPEAKQNPWDAEPRWPHPRADVLYGDYVGGILEFDCWLFPGGKCGLSSGSSSTYYPVLLEECEKLTQEWRACAAACRAYIAAFPWKGPQKFSHPDPTAIFTGAKGRFDYFFIRPDGCDYIYDAGNESAPLPIGQSIESFDENYREAAEYAQRYIAAGEMNENCAWCGKPKSEHSESAIVNGETLLRCEGTSSQFFTSLSELKNPLTLDIAAVTAHGDDMMKQNAKLRRQLAEANAKIETLAEDIETLRMEDEAVRRSLGMHEQMATQMVIEKIEQLATPSPRMIVEGFCEAAERAGYVVALTRQDDLICWRYGSKSKCNHTPDLISTKLNWKKPEPKEDAVAAAINDLDVIEDDWGIMEDGTKMRFDNIRKALEGRK